MPATELTTRPSRGRRLALGVIVLFLGGSGLVYEYCLSTVATHLLGNSIEQFSVIIALMLFAMGLAGIAQRAIRIDRLGELFLFVEILLGLIGGVSAIGLYLAFAYLEHFRLVLYGMALLIGFGIGMEIPLLMRINQRWQPELRDNVGQVLSLDYIGALIGALVWAFVLLPLFALDRISLVLGLINTGVAAITLLLFWRQLRWRPAIMALLLGCLVALGAVSAAAPSLIEGTRQRLYAAPIRHHVLSPYQDIVVTGRGQRLTLYLNGRLQLDSEDEFIYHEMLVHPALMSLGRPPRDVLVLGGGDGMAVREVLKWKSVEKVTLVDLDPAVTNLARTYPPIVALNKGSLQDRRVTVKPAAGVSPGPETRPVEVPAERLLLSLRRHRERVAKVQVINLDADRFIHEIDQSYDVIIADFPDPRSPDLAKLFSVELYDRVRARLRADGVLSVQAGSPYTTRRAFWSIHDTIVAAGFKTSPLHALVPTFGEWGFLLARLDLQPNPEGRIPIRTRYLTRQTLAAARIFGPLIARPKGRPLVSTRLDPLVMRLYLQGEPLDGPRYFPGNSTR